MNNNNNNPNPSNTLKMLLVVFNISIQEEVLETITANGTTCFTQWPRLTGNGKSTGPKMDNNVWPGANSAIMTVAPKYIIDNIFADIQHLRDEIGTHEGVKAFILNVENMTGDI